MKKLSKDELRKHIYRTWGTNALLDEHIKRLIDLIDIEDEVEYLKKEITTLETVINYYAKKYIDASYEDVTDRFAGYNPSKSK